MTLWLKSLYTTAFFLHRNHPMQPLMIYTLPRICLTRLSFIRKAVWVWRQIFALFLTRIVDYIQIRVCNNHFATGPTFLNEKHQKNNHRKHQPQIIRQKGCNVICHMYTSKDLYFIICLKLLRGEGVCGSCHLTDKTPLLYSSH